MFPIRSHQCTKFAFYQVHMIKSLSWEIHGDWGWVAEWNGKWNGKRMEKLRKLCSAAEVLVLAEA